MTYKFETANMGTVELSIVGEYTDGTKDVDAFIEGNGARKVFNETDDANEVFEWLIAEGVEFESDKTMWFNVHYLASVMIDGDATRDDLLHEVAKHDDRFFADWRSYWF